MTGFLILVAAASLTVSLLLTLLMMRLAPRLKLVAEPGGRRIHESPTPMGGGVAIFVATWLPIWISVAFCFLSKKGAISPADLPLPPNLTPYIDGILERLPALTAIFAGGFVLWCLGLADDRWDISPWIRLAVEIAVAVFLVFNGISVELFIENAFLRGLISVLWIVGLINAFNFLDNMDGLSAGVALIISLFFSVVAFQSQHFFIGAALCGFVGALSGFLMFNFPPAHIFMGDSGSTTLGYILAVLSVEFTFFQPERPYFPIVVPLIMFGLPLFDMITVVWIRLRAGRSPFRGDNNHFSHRLLALGMKPWQAVLTIYLVTITVALGGTVLYYASSTAILVILAQTVAVFTIIGILETSGRKKNGQKADPESTIQR